MKQLKDRPEVKPPLDAAIDTKGKLQRASFPLLQKLKLARRKNIYTNCNNKQGPPSHMPATAASDAEPEPGEECAESEEGEEGKEGEKNQEEDDDYGREEYGHGRD